ncbi:unnamed protein product, partial [Mesorhabditis belari]|uniref:Uncharacterized protein n=1 Tax=Mesorhabditis belari TaxID=2138241 RepID=A0AAF3EZE2_9BILA
MQKFFLIAVFLSVLAVSVFGFEEGDEVISRVYRALLSKAKRSPSMGLSLAEYMAKLRKKKQFSQLLITNISTLTSTFINQIID